MGRSSVQVAARAVGRPARKKDKWHPIYSLTESFLFSDENATNNSLFLFNLWIRVDVLLLFVNWWSLVSDGVDLTWQVLAINFNPPLPHPHIPISPMNRKDFLVDFPSKFNEQSPKSNFLKGDQMSPPTLEKKTQIGT